VSSVRNQLNRAEKRAATVAPACVPGTRLVRSWRRYADELYQLGTLPDDVCPACGLLGCGVLVLEEVIVTNSADGTLIDARGVEVAKAS
jgi:hypothetical protein